ncbi:MAG TPA: exopolysaccharide Pel transporter PelG [Polyangiales bacterium]|nr:exopolysaccharide Pel transporter PelG [Polyangiales bacterium]
MAGVGFSLRTLHRDGGYTGLLKLYGAAGLISSGPWLLSIMTLLLIGMLGRALVPDPAMLVRFQVSVTWLFAGSLILTGPLQLMFTRFIADRDYLGERDLTVPNLFGALAFTSVTTAAVALALSPLFPQESLFLKLLLGMGLVTLSDIWIVIVVLTGLRAHDKVLLSFVLGYAVTLGATLVLARFGEVGMLSGFVVGQATLLFAALAMIVRSMPSRTPASFRFMRRKSLFFELGLVGVLYNVGVWVDKWMFWSNPETSRAVLGPLRSSEVYDLPIFLAYLTLVPGMAVFLVRVETDFAESHASFYGAVRHGASLRKIQQLCNEMTDSARRAVMGIMKVQSASFVVAVCLGPWLLELFGISVLHLPLFYIDAAGVALQVLLLSVTSMFFYLDRRRAVSALVVLLVVSNAVLTWASQQLGPEYYGYGFASAMAITSLAGLWMLSRVFSTLVRDTFMLQRSAG